MATTREQIEHLEHYWEGIGRKPWKKLSYSRKWLKKQMSRFMRRRNKKIEDDDISIKQNKRPYLGWEY